MDGDWRGHSSLRIYVVLGPGHGVTVLVAGRNVNLHQRWLRRAVIRHVTKRAATRELTDGRLRPALTLDWDAWVGAEILLELVVA